MLVLLRSLSVQRRFLLKRRAWLVATFPTFEKERRKGRFMIDFLPLAEKGTILVASRPINGAFYTLGLFLLLKCGHFGRFGLCASDLFAPLLFQVRGRVFGMVILFLLESPRLQTLSEDLVDFDFLSGFGGAALEILEPLYFLLLPKVVRI